MADHLGRSIIGWSYAAEEVRRYAATCTRCRESLLVIREAARGNRRRYLCGGRPGQLSLGTRPGATLHGHGEWPCGLVALLCGESG
jgi:hypothetical protein